MDKNVVALPTREECQEFWELYKTPLHIREHMKQVNRVACYVAEKLQAAGESVMIALVDRASLLHDTLRVTEWDTLSFQYFPYTPSADEIEAWETQRRQYPSGMPHAAVNERIFAARYPEMAHVIGMHSITSTPFLKTWEEKIVNYADRRVAHSAIVSVQERLDEGFARYSKTSARPLERDEALVQKIYSIENEIFSIIGGDPNRLPV